MSVINCVPECLTLAQSNYFGRKCSVVFFESNTFKISFSIPPKNMALRKNNSQRFICRAMQQVSNLPSQQLTGTELEKWNSNISFIESIGFSREVSENLLVKAFGWTRGGYWRGDIVKSVPELETTQQVILYLQSLGVEGENLKTVIKEFPYVLACDIEKRLKPNVEKLDRDWKINGPSLKGVLTRNPIILGYTLDCKGDCISECDYCWARF